MRVFYSVGIVLTLLLCGAAPAGSRAAGGRLSGDYVEARTASVFAGACHYNSELTTAGRDAIAAWNVTSGNWEGIDLAGVRALAIVSSDANLSDATSARRSQLIVDTSASDAQAAAMVKAVKSRYAAMLGRVIVVIRAPVGFSHDGHAYSVTSPGTATIHVERMPDDLCCRMPQLVWHEPLVLLAGRKVGYTTRAEYAGGAVGEAWQRRGENSAFYGAFSF